MRIPQPMLQAEWVGESEAVFSQGLLGETTELRMTVGRPQRGWNIVHVDVEKCDTELRHSGRRRMTPGGDE